MNDVSMKIIFKDGEKELVRFLANSAAYNDAAAEIALNDAVLLYTMNNGRMFTQYKCVDNAFVRMVFHGDWD